MVNRYKREAVLTELYTMMTGVCKDVYTSSRPTVKDTTDKFVVIRLPQGIRPVSDIHNTAYVQLHLYAKDRANGVEHVQRIEELVDGVLALIPFDTELMSCNETPVQLESKSDGLGYHSVVIQFRITIKI